MVRLLLKVFLPLLVLGGLASVALSFVLFQPSLARRAAPEPPVLYVRVETAEREPVVYNVKSQGTVTPRTETVLVSRVSGPIEAIADSFVSGGFFHENDILVRIEATDYLLAVRRAKSDLVRFTTEVADQQVLAEFDLRYRTQPVAGTQLTEDQSVAAPQLADLKRALAQQESAQTDLDRAEVNLQRTLVRAPYDGLVVEKMADVGQVVGSQSQLARIVAVDYAEIRLPITLQELQFLDLPIGSNTLDIPVELSALVEGGLQTWDARVVRTEGVIDQQSRVIYAVAQIEDPYRRQTREGVPLRIGTFVTAKVRGLDAGNLFVIPRHSIQKGNSLWIVDANNEIYPVELQIERADEEFAYASSGIEDGDRYLVTLIENPLPGMKVRYDG